MRYCSLLFSSLLMISNLSFGAAPENDQKPSSEKAKESVDARKFFEAGKESEDKPRKDPPLTLRYAIEQTIQNQWAIRSSELNVETQLGLFQQASGAFNTIFNSSFNDLYQFDLQSPLGLIKSHSVGRVTTTNVGLSKLTRLGTALNINYANTNTLNQFTIPTEPPRSDNTILSFNLVQPLLRNLFYSPTTILEQTQKLEFEAARLQNIQNIATSVSNTLTAYWGVVGAKKVLAVYIELEKKLAEFAKIAEQLVEENLQGKASLHQPYANLANATVLKIQAEQNWISTYNNLLFFMGLPAVSPTDRCIDCNEFQDFLPVNSLEEFSCPRFELFMDQIVNKRADLAASLLLETSARLNLGSALNSIHPELDLLAGVSLVNTNSGRHSSLYESFPFNRFEKDISMGVSLSFPFCNDRAKGLVRQQRAALLQAQVNTDQLEAQIFTEFNTAFTLNNLLIKELDKAITAAKEFKASTDTEMVKLQEGLSTYFDVLALANDTASAQVQEAIIKTMFFQNLVQIYLLTGNLVCWKQFLNTVEVLDIETMMHSGCLGIATSQ